jgi:hypothetical protein
MSDTKPTADLPSIQKKPDPYPLARVASQSDDIGAVQKQIDMILTIVDKALLPRRQK